MPAAKLAPPGSAALPSTGGKSTGSSKKRPRQAPARAPRASTAPAGSAAGAAADAATVGNSTSFKGFVKKAISAAQNLEAHFKGAEHVFRPLLIPLSDQVEGDEENAFVKFVKSKENVEKYRLSIVAFGPPGTRKSWSLNRRARGCRLCPVVVCRNDEGRGRLSREAPFGPSRASLNSKVHLGTSLCGLSFLGSESI